MSKTIITAATASLLFACCPPCDPPPPGNVEPTPRAGIAIKEFEGYPNQVEATFADDKVLFQAFVTNADTEVVVRTDVPAFFKLLLSASETEEQVGMVYYEEDFKAIPTQIKVKDRRQQQPVPPSL